MKDKLKHAEFIFLHFQGQQQSGGTGGGGEKKDDKVCMQNVTKGSCLYMFHMPLSCLFYLYNNVQYFISITVEVVILAV